MERSPTATLLCAIGLLLGLMMGPAKGGKSDVEASSRPAVDGLNVKLTIGHSFDQADIMWGSGSLAIPLGHRFGLQIDAAAAEADVGILRQSSIYGVGLHLFWRDPTRAMLGLYAHTVHLDDFGGVNFQVAAVESELYWDRVSLANIVGVSDADFLDIEFFNRFTIAYYPLDNLRLSVGHSYGYGRHALTLAGEWAVGNANTATSSMLANGSVQEDGEASATAGLRLYLGQHDKSLIRRHREDDPQGSLAIAIGDAANAITNSSWEGSSICIGQLACF